MNVSGTNEGILNSSTASSMNMNWDNISTYNIGGNDFQNGATSVNLRNCIYQNSFCNNLLVQFLSQANKIYVCFCGLTDQQVFLKFY